MRCKHISISKAFQKRKAKISPLLSSFRESVYHCRVGVALHSTAHTNISWYFAVGDLQVDRFQVFQTACSMWYLCSADVCLCDCVHGPSFYTAVRMFIVLLTELWLCLIYYTEEMPWFKLNTHIFVFRLICACVHTSPTNGGRPRESRKTTTKIRLVEKSERISDMLCNRECVFCTLRCVVGV